MKKLLPYVSIGTAFLTLATSAFAQTIKILRPKLVPDTEIGGVIGAVVGVVLIIAAVLAFIFLLLGGIQWITSGGDKAGLEAARNKITNAIVGLIIVASAWAIMLLVGQFTGLEFFGQGINIPTIENPLQ
ncbi:TPA: hypothetical protein DIV55_05705 [Patescibacteria group bacterium]|uniref:Integral membrane protein n=1 Tax=Candidatus Gottesmanbacteria bacterium GW2011_GWA1_43_11 TaxID=1618436 RepID=A0A0G1CJE6_9BACT|nr:MAG: hypothetical protein UV59_C0006G0065 [Candidatus Gottesmanbacteria bacterium GW2011_GWA1_43_11]HCS79203.1 hypothetical protein [Patescibacteria group bacterium]